jgi:hypothetical protein
VDYLLPAQPNHALESRGDEGLAVPTHENRIGTTQSTGSLAVPSKHAKETGLERFSVNGFEHVEEEVDLPALLARMARTSKRLRFTDLEERTRARVVSNVKLPVYISTQYPKNLLITVNRR